MQRRTLLSAMLASPLAVALAPEGAQAATVKTGFVPGKVAPDLSLLSATGSTMRLSDFRGRYVVLDLSTMWCPFSLSDTREVRPFVDAMNAPKALKAPFTWITAEFDNTVQAQSAATEVAPTPGQLVRFGLKWNVGDAKSPVTSFGPVGGAMFTAGQSQLASYGTWNGDQVGYPTFVVLNPNGIILTVLQGYVPLTDPHGATPTLTLIAQAMKAKTVPFTPTAPPYTAPVLDGVAASATVDGSSGSATLHPSGTYPDTAELGNGYALSAGAAYGSADYLYDSIAIVLESSQASLPTTSTYEIAVGDATWTSTGEFTSLARVTGGCSVQLALQPGYSTDPQLASYYTTAVPVDASGHAGPFVLQDVLDAEQTAIAQLFTGTTFTVVALILEAGYDGPVVSTYGQ